MPDRWVDEPVPCRDPECPEPQPSAQPEADGALRYYACRCGYEFPAEMASQGEGACQLGVPEEVRRQFQQSMDYQDSQMRGAVFLGGISRRPE